MVFAFLHFTHSAVRPEYGLTGYTQQRRVATS
jgi:hypothetical protein